MSYQHEPYLSRGTVPLSKRKLLFKMFLTKSGAKNLDVCKILVLDRFFLRTVVPLNVHKNSHHTTKPTEQTEWEVQAHSAVVQKAPPENYFAASAPESVSHKTFPSNIQIFVVDPQACVSLKLSGTVQASNPEMHTEIFYLKIWLLQKNT